jgi:hypothetical protein
MALFSGQSVTVGSTESISLITLYHDLASNNVNNYIEVNVTSSTGSGEISIQGVQYQIDQYGHTIGEPAVQYKNNNHWYIGSKDGYYNTVQFSGLSAGVVPVTVNVYDYVRNGSSVYQELKDAGYKDSSSGNVTVLSQNDSGGGDDNTGGGTVSPGTPGTDDSLTPIT